MVQSGLHLIFSKRHLWNKNYHRWKKYHIYSLVSILLTLGEEIIVNTLNIYLSIKIIFQHPIVCVCLCYQFLECPIGLYSDNCSEKCSPPNYGEDCQSICQCPDVDCNFVYGCLQETGTLTKHWQLGIYRFYHF